MTLRAMLAPAAALFLAAALPAAPLHAQGAVVASSPAEGATVQSPRVLSLTFAAAMPAPATAASVVMTAMPGVDNHGEMVIRNFTTAWSPDGRTLTLTLKQPLKAGDYDLRWQSTGADGRRTTGTVRFVVR